ncbi:hypothetical protein ACIFOC_00615 [Leucobacter aridicollis]|uniref:DUF4190 domain-containing protein n=1 Tax=Leucobacter aridicollis TaxID=283878 RepID=UPI002167D123|nr:DUF4190 domain-containing protein [Leucobacter aridicollis]MCS3426916.1 hypothetical protein [Leucobacter aridicollis]
MSTTEPTGPTQHQPSQASEQPTVQLPYGAPSADAAGTTGTAGAAAPQYGYEAPAYAYPAQGATPQRTTVKDTNTYALVAIVLAFIAPIAGIIFGHLGLNQIKRTGDAGRGLALTAVIYGYCAIALGVLFVVMYIGFIVMIVGAAASGSYYY